MNAIADKLPGWRYSHGTNAPTGWNQDQLAEYGEWILSFQDRPYDWACVCYPWGEVGSPLEDRSLEIWQTDMLQHLQKQLQRSDLSYEQKFKRVLRYAVAAGNGVGKTAYVAILVHWFTSTHPSSEAVVTAGTLDQLSGKTWRELSKWQNLAINGWQFEWTATRYKCKEQPETWFVEARAWSVANPDAMAGTHENYVLIVFDEASAIARIIWDTIEGAFTTGLCFFFCFGNPTSRDGAFFDCFYGRIAHRWFKRHVDAREVSFANQEELQSWIDKEGYDSDFVRIHVRGLFPKQSDLQFIDSAVVEDARKRIVQWRDIPRAIPRLMGVDIARQGVDQNVIILRQGRKMHKDICRFRERDTMKTAGKIIEQFNLWRPDLIFVDGVGMGGPVVDYLRTRGLDRTVVDVQSGTSPALEDDKKRYSNMRAVMWARMKEWLRTADIPEDVELLEELCLPHYKFTLKTDLLQIESKESMRERGIKSPDTADALAFTFWELVPSAPGFGGGYAEED